MDVLLCDDVYEEITFINYGFCTNYGLKYLYPRIMKVLIENTPIFKDYSNK